MDAWEELKAGSTITTGDAYDHLLAQGGTGGGETLIISGDVEVDADDVAVEIAVANITDVLASADQQATVETDKTTSVDVDGIKTDVGVCP